jgi:hypothetical protein
LALVLISCQEPEYQIVGMDLPAWSLDVHSDIQVNESLCPAVVRSSSSAAFLSLVVVSVFKLTCLELYSKQPFSTNKSLHKGVNFCFQLYCLAHSNKPV